MRDTEQLFALKSMSNQSLNELASRIEQELMARENEKGQREDAIDSSIREAIEDNYGVIFTLFYDNGDTDVFRLDNDTSYMVEVERRGD